jgi:hypothetical protein
MFNSKCTCGCLNVDMYRIVLYFVTFCYSMICVCIFYLGYFWSKLLTGICGQTPFTSGPVMAQATGLSPQRPGFSVRPGHVEFVVGKVTLGKVLL